MHERSLKGVTESGQSFSASIQWPSRAELRPGRCVAPLRWRDKFLCCVAESLTSCTRPSDHAARYGGEEFALILTGTLANNAVIVAERIRSHVQQTLHGSMHVTVSIGVAEYHPHEGQSPAELLAEADRALYLAKRCGRNRVHLAGVQFFGANPVDSYDGGTRPACSTLPATIDLFSSTSG